MADPSENNPTSADYYSSADGEYVVVNGENHFINTDTDILNLDNNIVATPDPAVDDINDEDEIAPVENEIEMSPDGILDEETIGRALSNLGRTASGAHQAYLYCSVPGFNLKDISLLAEFIHLQKVDVAYNELTDLSPLSSLEHLLILDASHNQIVELLQFKAPKNLMSVDLSFNNIEEMSDLSDHHYLQKLCLDNNQISKMEGMSKCKRLSFLSMAHNKLNIIQGLDDLPLKHLNLSNNQLTSIDNLESLSYLRHIDLSNNNISCLQGLAGHNLLEYIDLENNQVGDIEEIGGLMGLKMLRELNLLGNPIQEIPDSTLSVLFRLQFLTSLNRTKVEVEEKVAARNMFAALEEVVASRDHIMHIVYSFLQPNRVWDSTLPNIQTVYPMLVLVGPPESGKKVMALKLTEEFSDFFGYGTPDTTRKPHTDEPTRRDYNFVSLEQFESDIRSGQFILTYECNGEWYGLQMESVENVARDGLACVVHMELEGVLSLKNTYFEPRYVLILPQTPEEHEKRLRSRQVYTEDQIEETLARAEFYKDYNQDHPGFFDMMIAGDDTDTSYRSLRRLVMDYLGVGSMSTEMGFDQKDGTRQSDMFVPPGVTTTTTTTTNSSNVMTTCTWSKPSMHDSMSQSRGKATSPSTTGRGIVEEESLKRRHSAAKGVVSGYVRPLYEQLLTGYPRTAPQMVNGQVGLGDDVDPRAYSAPIQQTHNMGAIPPGSPDSSSDSANSSAGLSDLDSATELDRSTPPGHGNMNTNFLPTETVNPLQLISEQVLRSASQNDLPEAKPPSAPRDDSQNRPGSNRHKVLPPINTPPQACAS